MSQKGRQRGASFIHSLPGNVETHAQLRSNAGQRIGQRREVILRAAVKYQPSPAGSFVQLAC